MSARPTAREGIRELSIDDHVVLYDPITRRAHLLNASAAAIWSRCNGDEDLDQIARHLAERFDAPFAAVRADVQSTVDRFVEVDLLGPAHSRPSGSGWSATTDTGDRVADAYPRAERELGPFAAFDHRFVVATVDPDLVEPITAGLAGIVDESSGGADERHRYDITVDGDHHVVLFDERLVRVAATGAEAVSFLYWHVHRQAIEQATDLVRLHAAAVRVGRPRRGVARATRVGQVDARHRAGGGRLRLCHRRGGRLRTEHGRGGRPAPAHHPRSRVVAALPSTWSTTPTPRGDRAHRACRPPGCTPARSTRRTEGATSASASSTATSPGRPPRCDGWRPRRAGAPARELVRARRGRRHHLRRARGDGPGPPLPASRSQQPVGCGGGGEQRGA